MNTILFNVYDYEMMVAQAFGENSNGSGFFAFLLTN